VVSIEKYAFTVITHNSIECKVWSTDVTFSFLEENAGALNSCAFFSEKNRLPDDPDDTNKQAATRSKKVYKMSACFLLLRKDIVA